MGSGETQPTQPKSDGHTARRNGRSEKRNGIGNTKATPARIKAILRDLALGLTREQACAANGCSLDAFQAWEKRPEFADLRAKAQAARIKYLLKAKDQAIRQKLDWKGIAWDLEKAFRSQFGDLAKLTIHASQHNWTLPEEKAREIHDREARLLLELKNEQGAHNNGQADDNT
jgi:hypothetical protein